MAGDKSWARTPGTYIAGRAYLDGADETASEMEAKWGCDRLRLLVGPELREKFDRQRYLLNQAIWHGELEAVRREAGRMVAAWQALDRAAVAAGKQPISPLSGRSPLEDGGGRDRARRCQAHAVLPRVARFRFSRWRKSAGCCRTIPTSPRRSWCFRARRSRGLAGRSRTR
jgi:hypothetical protein